MKKKPDLTIIAATIIAIINFATTTKRLNRKLMLDRAKLQEGLEFEEKKLVEEKSENERIN